MTIPDIFAVESLSGITYYDNFNRADTSPGTLGTNDQGITWDVRGVWVGSFPMPAATDGFISSNKYIYGGNSTCYASLLLRGTLSKVGVKLQRKSLHVGQSFATTFAMVISANSNLISDMIHFIWSYIGWSLQIRDTAQGDGSFITLATGTFDASPGPGWPARLNFNQDYWFQIEVVASDTIKIIVPHVSPITIVDSRFSYLVGPYCFWEEFANGAEPTLVDYWACTYCYAVEQGQSPIIPTPPL